MASYVDDIEFVLREVRRFDELVQQLRIKEIDKFDCLCSLPRKGGSFWICGQEAEKRLIGLAKRCIENSTVTRGKLKSEDVLKLLKRLISETFITNSTELTTKNAKGVVKKARAIATESIAAIIHYVPCLLAEDKDHNEFKFGPVLFLSKDKAIAELMGKITEPESDDLEDALEYYKKFPWIARIELPPCSAQVSEDRTQELLSYVFDALSVIFTADGANKMGFQDIPPPSTEALIITSSNSGSIKAGRSISWHYHNFQSDWVCQLDAMGFNPFINSIGEILKNAYFHDEKTPLGQRILNSLRWYGDAAREKSAGARIVKFATTIEVMVMTSSSQAKKKTFAHRGTALIEGIESKNTKPLRKHFERLYDYRSDILHGRVSYHEPSWTKAREAERLCRNAIFGAIQLYTAIGLKNDEKLSDAFDAIVAANDASISDKP